MNKDDIEELIMEQENDLTTEDFQEILKKQFEEKVDGGEQILISASKDILKKWEDVRELILKRLKRIKILSEECGISTIIIFINYVRKVMKTREK